MLLESRSNCPCAGCSTLTTGCLPGWLFVASWCPTFDRSIAQQDDLAKGNPSSKTLRYEPKTTNRGETNDERTNNDDERISPWKERKHKETCVSHALFSVNSASSGRRCCARVCLCDRRVRFCVMERRRETEICLARFFFSFFRFFVICSLREWGVCSKTERKNEPTDD